MGAQGSGSRLLVQQRRRRDCVGGEALAFAGRGGKMVLARAWM